MSDRKSDSRRSLPAIFGSERPLVGMIHLLPLPGSPLWGGSMDQVVDRAVSDAKAIMEGGMDAAIVENLGDMPFHATRVPAETIAAVSRVTTEVLAEVSLPVGVNVLRNDAAAALAISAATGASFIRVNVHTGATLTDQGWIRGNADSTLRMRRHLGLPTAILADVHVKHGRPAPGVTLEEAARDCWARGLADGLIVSGSGTGEPTRGDTVRIAKTATPDAPVWVGSGVTPESAAGLLQHADGLIVGSTLHAKGRLGAGVLRSRVEALVRAARG